MEMEKKSLQVSRHIATDVLLHNEKKLKFYAKANPNPLHLHTDGEKHYIILNL